MQKIGNAYVKYFNHKYNRTGGLYESPFKSIEVKSDNYLLWLSAYINGNAEIHKIAKAKNWPWSSYPDYVGARNGKLCEKKIILKDFTDTDEYKNFVKTTIKESREKKDDIKKYLME